MKREFRVIDKTLIIYGYVGKELASHTDAKHDIIILDMDAFGIWQFEHDQVEEII